MNRNIVMAISPAVSGTDFSACTISMSKIIYHGLGFDK